MKLHDANRVKENAIAWSTMSNVEIGYRLSVQLDVESITITEREAVLIKAAMGWILRELS